MSKIVATFTINQKNRTIHDLKITQKQFRFKCKRNATLCCKLGGPILTKKDIQQIQKAGHLTDDFLEANKISDSSSLGSLKTRPDGSCIFLTQDKDQNKHNCSIYTARPALCRLYPFNFEFLGTNRIALSFIPCCLGLKNPEGKVLDENFVTTVLLEPLFDAIQLSKMGTQTNT